MSSPRSSDAPGDARRPDPEAGDARLTEHFYRELHDLAVRAFAGESKGHTLQPTAVVHEACLRMLTSSPLPDAPRAERLALAARVLRQVLVDHHRARSAEKRGGLRERVPLTAASPETRDPTEEILAVHEALDHLHGKDPFLARVVELRFFGGLTEADAAEVLGVSERTVRGAWATARLLLHERLS